MEVLVTSASDKQIGKIIIGVGSLISTNRKMKKRLESFYE